MELANRSYNYGPRGISIYSLRGYSYQNDRVQHVWNLFEATQLSLALTDENAILFEFGAGTGQMASVVRDSGFRGIHVVYDFLEMNLLQRHFHTDGLNGSRFITAGGGGGASLMPGGVTNYLPVGDIHLLTAVLSRPKLTFVSTYAFTETDLATQKLFAPYFINFDGFYIVYWDKFGNVQNQPTINAIAKMCLDTHDTSDRAFFGNGRVLRGGRKK